MFSNAKLLPIPAIIHEFSSYLFKAWLLSIAKNSKGTGYQCVLERKDGIATYLFFQEFSMDVTGAKLANAELMVCSAASPVCK
jgi:hypothetical protein